MLTKEREGRTKEGKSARTRERILDAAERVFANRGFHAASVRAITSEAGVNLASVHYHFGSKEALIEAVFERRIGPLNRERLEMLDRVERKAGSGLPRLEGIIEALVAPALRLCIAHKDGGDTFMRLMGRAHGEPDQRIAEIVLEQMREIARRFSRALACALPQLPIEEVFWRLHFAVGAMVFTMMASRSLEKISGRLCCGIARKEDVESSLGRLVPFLAAGMRAPLPGSAEKGFLNENAVSVNRDGGEKLQ